MANRYRVAKEATRRVLLKLVILYVRAGTAARFAEFRVAKEATRRVMLKLVILYVRAGTAARFAEFLICNRNIINVYVFVA